MKNKKMIVLVVTLFVFLCCGLAQEHPYLYFQSEKISDLKYKLSYDKEVKNAYATIVKVADNALKEENPYEKIEYLSLVYLVSGKKKYADKIKKTILMTAAKESLEPLDMLHREPAWTSILATAKANFQMAIGYDAIYNSLSMNERMDLANAIYKIGIKPTLHDWLSPYTRFHTINSMGHNYWIACTGMMGVASMAVYHEFSEANKWLDMACDAANQWINFSGDIMQNKLLNFDNGAYYESVNYANYGTSQYLYFRLALKSFRPDFSLQDADVLPKIADYFIHVCYPNGKDISSLYFGDSDLKANGEAPLKLLWALGYQKPDILWYLSNVRSGQAKEGMPLDTPMGILYTPNLYSAPKVPNLPTSILYSQIGWASMRSSWDYDATLLGVKCGHTWNHSHADAGSFILFHKGEQVLKDAGNCWYPNPLYREYFFQSQAHNVLLFDGKAQPMEQQYKGSMLDGTLNHLLDAGNIKYIMADATGPTSKFFSKNFRSFLWIDDVILIIDDVRSHDYGTFSFLLHPDGKSRKNGIDIEIVNRRAVIDIRPIWPEYLTESDFEHDFPDNLKLKAIQAPIAKQLDSLETYYSITCPARSNQIKFITAIILKESTDEKQEPEVTRLKGDDLMGVRIRYNRKVTDIYLNTRADGHIMHRNSCNLVNGWETDAYILAYSYDDEAEPTDASQIKEWFIGYGSYVRRGTQIVWDSYTKKNVVIKFDGEMYILD